MKRSKIVVRTGVCYYCGYSTIKHRILGVGNVEKTPCRSRAPSVLSIIKLLIFSSTLLLAKDNEITLYVHQFNLCKIPIGITLTFIFPFRFLKHTICVAAQNFCQIFTEFLSKTFRKYFPIYVTFCLCDSLLYFRYGNAYIIDAKGLLLY